MVNGNFQGPVPFGSGKGTLDGFGGVGVHGVEHRTSDHGAFIALDEFNRGVERRVQLFPTVDDKEGEPDFLAGLQFTR